VTSKRRERSERTRIRRARAADCATLTRLAHAAKRFWGYPETLIRLWRSDLTVTPESLRENAVYCATRGSRVVGFYALSGDGAERELAHMWVAPRHIGTGVGKLLFAHLRRRLRTAGATRLRVASDPHAQGFYLAMGARRVGRVASTPRGRTLPLLALRVQTSAGACRRMPR
jgi:GNAT superfamily N-acetyltransferase